mgnify:CR=1 FL=1
MAKVLVTLDDRLLARIDSEASSRGFSRSAYLSRLAALELNKRSGPGRTASSRRALAAIDDLFDRFPVAEDLTEAIRRERDAR